MAVPQAADPAVVPTGVGARLFGIDTRSLGAFRIGLGVLLLADLAVRVPDLEAHYSRLGVLPADVYRARWMFAPRLSLYFLHDSVAFQGTLFALAGVAALAVLFGYRTRLAMIVSWVMLVSLHGRNPFVLQGGDVMLRMLLFWGMFLPLGAVWSLDRYRAGRTASVGRRVLGIPTAAILLQVSLVYCFSAGLKANPLWLEDHSAIYYALHIDEVTTDAASIFLRFPALLGPLTTGVWWFEMIGPLLAWSPVASNRLRGVAIVLFVGLHVIFAICFAIGLFSYVMMLAWVLFVPSVVWDWIGTRGRATVASRAGEDHATGPVPAAFRFHPVTNALAAAFLVYVLCWNVYSLNKPRYGHVFTPGVRRLGYILGLDQTWNMFMMPYRDDGWWVLEGVLADGSVVDVARGTRPPSWEKPLRLHAEFPSYRWRKFMRNLWDAREFDGRLLYQYYCDYVCREWNRRHGPAEQMAALNVYYVVEWTLPDSLPTTQYTRVHLWTHDCATMRWRGRTEPAGDPAFSPPAPAAGGVFE